MHRIKIVVIGGSGLVDLDLRPLNLDGPGSRPLGWRGFPDEGPGRQVTVATDYTALGSAPRATRTMSLKKNP